MVTKGESGGGINWECVVNIYSLLFIKYINNKDLLYSTRSYIQYLVITYNGKESGKGYTYMYNQITLLYT